MTCEDENDDKTKNPGSSSKNQNHDPDNPKKSTTGKSTNDTRACAACKYQRRRCAPDCALAPYFPPDHQKEFLNAHKLFGLKNIMKIYKSVKPCERDVAMKSVIIEANMRARDPVGGCHRVIDELERQIQVCRAELGFVLNQLALAQNIDNNNTNSSVASSAAGCGGFKEPLVDMISMGYVAGQPTQYQPDPGGYYGDLYPAALGEAIAPDGSGIIEEDLINIFKEETKPDLTVSNILDSSSQKDEGQKHVPTQLHHQREHEGQTSMFSQKTSEFNNLT